jgi:hypothetical protein
MAVIDRRGQPLPEGHPLKDGALVILGGKRPSASNVPSGAPKVEDSSNDGQAARDGKEESQALAKHKT